MLAFLSLRQGAKTGIRLVGRFSPLFAITVREYTIVYRVHEERGVVCVVGVV
jgi:mRNA-degrading endonuclease RelE of RelBE toxin-antitoxin system